MEQLLFLALLAVVGLLRWFSQMAEERRNREAEKRTAPPAPNKPIQRAPAETEEERMRRFMEALGVPSAPAAPPPKAERRQAAPAPQPSTPAGPTRKTLPVDPFPRPRGGFPVPPPVAAPPAPPSLPSLPPQPELAPPPPRIPPTPRLPTRETTVLADPALPRGSAEFEVRDIDDLAEEAARTRAPRRQATVATRPAAPAKRTTLAARLATREGLRDAMVLREIFGPPRSMQPLDPHRPEMV